MWVTVPATSQLVGHSSAGGRGETVQYRAGPGQPCRTGPELTEYTQEVCSRSFSLLLRRSLLLLLKLRDISELPR